MEIKILKAERADSSVLRQLLEYYCYDFSEYLQTDVNEHGMFAYAYLDSYWIEPGRHPYFIKVDGKYAGFILINKDFLVLDDPAGHCVAEFFIMRKYRRRGIGLSAAKSVFAMHPGQWEISLVLTNQPSLKFWHKAVDEYTNGKYATEYKEKKDRQKQILLFSASKNEMA